VYWIACIVSSPCPDTFKERVFCETLTLTVLDAVNYCIHIVYDGNAIRFDLVGVNHPLERVIVFANATCGRVDYHVGSVVVIGGAAIEQQGNGLFHGNSYRTVSV